MKCEYKDKESYAYVSSCKCLERLDKGEQILKILLNQ